MLSTHTTFGTRGAYWGRVLGLALLLLAGGLLLTLGSWHPVAAQSDTPDTIVLPPFQMHIPVVFGESEIAIPCPTTSANVYESTPILGNPRDPNVPPYQDPDLSLIVRGYKSTVSLRQLIAINGPTDDDAPQLAFIFRPPRVPTFNALHQVYQWNWDCCPGGELGAPIAEPEVTLVEMATTPGEMLYPPGRNANIGRDFVALVLYAEKFRITFTYTAEDTPAKGYLVHVENFCVDPTLLALYEAMHVEGRDDLPALRRGDSIGTAFSEGVLVSVRDTGSFMDPRSAKDWWQDVVRARLAASHP